MKRVVKNLLKVGAIVAVILLFAYGVVMFFLKGANDIREEREQAELLYEITDEPMSLEAESKYLYRVTAWTGTYYIYYYTGLG